MKKIFLGVLMLMLSAAFVSAEPLERVITLKDGSTVQGRVTGLDKGEYIIQSATLGELRIKEENVVSLSAPKAPPPANEAELKAALGNSSTEAIQARMMSDPSTVADLQAIASDPQVMALVSDPAFVQAAQNKDTSAIQANPRTAELMKNPKVKALIEKMQASGMVTGH